MTDEAKLDKQILSRLRAEKEQDRSSPDFSALRNRLDQWATRTKKNDGYRTEDVLLLYAEAERMTTQLAEAWAVLEQLEWKGTDRDEGDWCGVCCEDKRKGHEPGCALEKALGRTATEER